MGTLGKMLKSGGKSAKCYGILVSNSCGNTAKFSFMCITIQYVVVLLYSVILNDDYSHIKAISKVIITS